MTVHRIWIKKNFKLALLKSSLFNVLGGFAPATVATPLAISMEIRFNLYSLYRCMIRDFNRAFKLLKTGTFPYFTIGEALASNGLVRIARLKRYG